MTDYNQVWCYDLEDKRNKLFKTIRIGEVEILEDGWMAEAMHERGFVDIFRFSGPERYRVKMELDVRARNVMVECFPLSEKYIEQVEDGMWLLDTEVCGLMGAQSFELTVAGAKIVDIGCGGGFPTIPLAILFPEVEFTAVDSIGKKITVVREIATALGLKNVTPINARIEAVKGEFDYVVSRAVTDMKTLKGWALPKLRGGQKGSLPNGMLILKGGDLAEELGEARLRCDIHRIGDMFEEEFFDTKSVIYARK